MEDCNKEHCGEEGSIGESKKSVCLCRDFITCGQLYLFSSSSALFLFILLFPSPFFFSPLFFLGRTELYGAAHHWALNNFFL